MVLSYIYIEVDDIVINLLIKDSDLSKVDIAIKTVMLASKISSKIFESTKYNETIANFIHSHQWKDAIKEKLYNLE